MSHPWHDIPELALAAHASEEIACLRAIRYLLSRGIGIRPDGPGFKAYDISTDHGIYAESLEACLFQACLAMHAAFEARRV